MPRTALPRRLKLAPCWAWPALCASPALAAEPAALPAPLEACAEIGTPADRLACYDKFVGRAPAPLSPGDAQKSSPPATTTLAPKDAPVAVATEPVGETSFLSKFWELEPGDKRGVFNLTGYRNNFVLPMHATNHINRNPQSPTQDAVSQPNYRNIEAKFQLSLRTKVAQDIGLPGGDVWLAFTQQAMWQVWNGADSKPFRNSDYEPEVMYVVPTGKGLRELPFGWQWRYTQLALAHQSNGQSDPLSRSWNRVYLGAGFERGDWSLVTRIAHRLKEDLASDNNPDLVKYRGRADFQANWAGGNHTASLLYRTTLQDGKYGALQFDWTYPVFKDQPNGLRWLVQAFSGYGETLTDYNFRQTSVGAGVSFLQF